MKQNEHRVYIGLGSNLHNPWAQLQSAIHELSELPQTQLIHISRFYQNPPMGYLNQPDFINAVVEMKTTLLPENLLQELLRIEILHHRVRSEEQNGPRTLDLDLLLYDNRIINTEHLIVPHPGLKDRPFVLYPLADINPDLIFPCGQALKDQLQKIPPTGLNVIEASLIMDSFS